MKSIYKIHLCFLFSLLSLSCSKWVEVKPNDRIGEDQLFANKEGYIKALNGVYVEMANRALYGQEMTAGTLDAMSGNYYTPGTTHVYYERTTFVYTSANTKATFDNAWRKAYELIANCNVILEKCGNAPSETLPEPYYGIVKGEALALRAFFHLDMLRLFGPIYSEENKLKAAIPYMAEAGFGVVPLSNSEQVMQKITADLNAALSLMENTDPIRTDGVRNANNPAGKNDLYYRQYRLNYYAAKALLARAYLWQGNKANALIQAEALLAEIQAPAKIVFPYVTAANATSGDKPDMLFSTEVMFAVYDINRVQMYNNLFNVNLAVTSKLSFTGENVTATRLTALYDDANDYRRRAWQNLSSGTVTALTNIKYLDIINTPGRYMIPLIRLSEVLLIAAEAQPDLAQGIIYLNMVRTSRNSLSLNPADNTALKTAIGNEFRKETMGEGQQFFFYKRNAQTTIPNHAALTGTKTMVLNNYVVPLPDSETSQRN